jgi:septum formation topological specificity factor MinE
MKPIETFGVGAHAETPVQNQPEETESHAAVLDGLREELQEMADNRTEDEDSAEAFHSKWIQEAVEELLLLQYDPEETERFWSEFDAAFADADGSERHYVEKVKDEILAYIADRNMESRIFVLDGMRKDIQGVILKEAEAVKKAENAKKPDNDNKAEDMKAAEELEKVAAQEKAKLFHSKWMKVMEEDLLKVIGFPDEAQRFWSEFSDTFAQGSPEEKAHAEKFKEEILSHVIARTILEGFEGKLAKQKIPVKIDVHPSTPQEDLEKMVNFWVQVERRGKRETVKRTFPVHVFNVDISQGSREEKRARGNFIKENFMDFELPTGNKRKFADRKTIEEMMDFYQKYPDGLAITLPIGIGHTLVKEGRPNEKFNSEFAAQTIDNKKSDCLFRFIP